MFRPDQRTLEVTYKLTKLIHRSPTEVLEPRFWLENVPYKTKCRAPTILAL
jgi:hypothetical protein